MAETTVSEAGAILTIGYGARTIEELIELLRAHTVDWLVDVRSHPYSRQKPEFSKRPLEARIDAAGIHYLFLGHVLGGMPDAVPADRYVQGDDFRRAIQRLVDAASSGRQLCLMCTEQEPRLCHRSYVIAAELQGRGVLVAHIDKDSRLVTHDELVRAEQLELFPPRFAQNV